MRLLAIIVWAAVLSPFGIILAKLLGWISWSWLVTVFVAMSILIVTAFCFLVIVVWIISQNFEEEWDQQ